MSVGVRCSGAAYSPHVSLNRKRSYTSLRGAVRSTRAWSRTVGAGRIGSMPHFLVIGAQRCGTTALFRYLAAHPQVQPATGKELQYFSMHAGRGDRWYRGHFPAADGELRTFEASPYYLFHPAVPARVASALPEARFVVLLRDPVERAYSHYLHSRSLGVEPLAFGAALDAEADRLRAAVRYGEQTRAAHHALRSFSYVGRGRYAEQLDRWFSHISPDRILIVRSENLYAHTSAVYGEILAFLELDPFRPGEFARPTRRADPGPSQLTPELRERLATEFAPHDARLARMLDWAQAWPRPVTC